MNNQLKEFISLLDSSSRILITSHISPDPDALCSVLLAGTSLKTKYPDKQIFMTMEELTGDLNFLAGYDQILNQPFLKTVNDKKPDLIIILDAMNYGRCTRGNIQDIQQIVAELKSKLVIIDHHEPESIEPNVIYINNQSPATAQDAYEIFIKGLGVKPDGFAQTALLGIISDTNRFLYDNPNHQQTFKVANELIDAGASIEQIVNDESRYSVDDMKVLSEVARNTVQTKGYTYSFISDNFIKSWQSQNKTADELKRGSGYYLNEFIRNIGPNKWGFIVYKDIAEPQNTYSVSFRAVNGTKDVSLLAKQLGGGGHKSAAGAKLGADSVSDAINKVISVLSSEV